MRLYIARKTRRWSILRPRYVLQASVELTLVEARIIAQHCLQGDELAAGPAALEADEAGESALDLARDVDGWDDHAVRKAVRLKVNGLWLALVAANTEARITIGELIAGRTFEASDVVELAMLQNLIEVGFEALQDKVAMLAAYDSGDELLSEDEDDDEGTAPQEWGKFQ